MKGFFTSALYRDRDWSGKGREVFYMDMQPTFMFCPGHPHGLLSTDILKKDKLSFRWNGGHYGREFPAAYSARLDGLWAE